MWYDSWQQTAWWDQWLVAIMDTCTEPYIGNTETNAKLAITSSIFYPFATETAGKWHDITTQLTQWIGRHITTIIQEVAKETTFLFQRLSTTLFKTPWSPNEHRCDHLALRFNILSAEMAAEQNLEKHPSLSSYFVFSLLSLKIWVFSTLWSFLMTSAVSLVAFSVPCNEKPHSFSNVCRSTERFNSVLLHDTFVCEDILDNSHFGFVFISLF